MMDVQTQVLGRGFGAQLRTEEVKYHIEGDDLNIFFSAKDGYDDQSAISRAQGVSDMPGVKLYRMISKERILLYPLAKKNVLGRI